MNAPHEQIETKLPPVDSTLTGFQNEVANLYRIEARRRVANATGSFVNGFTQRDVINEALDALASELRAVVEMIEAT